MLTLIIYDSDGYVITEMSGSVREPVGIPFLWVEIPKGKRLKTVNGIGVDTTVTPHQVILEDIPPTEAELLKQQVNELQDALVEIADIVAGGTTNG